MYMLYRVKEDFTTQFHRFRAGMIVAMHEISGMLTDAHMAKLAPVNEMEIVSDNEPVVHADAPVAVDTDEEEHPE